jgi:hypothetical protein
MAEQRRDYNGPDDWSLEAVRQRYRAHAQRLGQGPVEDLQVRRHREGLTEWIYPVMDSVIVGIRAGDLACIELGVEFVESGHRQPFGRTLHANTARALRRAALRPEHIKRLRTRILRMLETGEVPHEYREYAKLLRRIGLGGEWPAVRRRVDESNPYVMRYVRYFENHGDQDGV